MPEDVAGSSSEGGAVTGSPSPKDRLYAIVEQGLCTGCGLCQSVAGADKVKVCKTSSGYERPVVIGELDHAAVDRIYDTCPGTRVDGMPARLSGAGAGTDNVWGLWRRIVRAWAADPVARFEGATGGVLTALADYLLASGRVEFILHAKASGTEPTFGEKHLSFTHADVMAGAGSRYGPTAPLVDVGEALDRGQPFAFIGKPCDISALRNYARHDKRVDGLVKYWLTLVCGGYMPPESMDSFLRGNDIDPDEVTAMRYRGRGCPGPTQVATRERTVEFHYLDLWGEDETQWKLPFRCKICPDGIGESADLVAADTWVGGAPTREGSTTDPGVNAVIARTEAGLDLLQAAEKDGFVVIQHDIAPDEMSVYQPHQLRKKYAVWPRFQGLEDEGRIVPQAVGLRIKELAEELPEAHSAYQREGARRRVREGKASEPTPIPVACRFPGAELPDGS